MHYMQFRIHPSVGFARMGNSPDAYYLASDFPRFLQEAYPQLRLRPRPRTMPQDDTGQPSPAPGPFQTFDDQKPPASQKATNDRFKDKAGKIVPQAARFRVFAYCYGSKDAEFPSRVFEVTTDHADIEWKVRLANHKAQTGQDVHVVRNNAAVSVKTDTAKLLRLPVTPDPIAAMGVRPPLAYLFLERNAADKTKVNGRLHLIGNAGEITYFGAAGKEFDEGLVDLWYDNWFDSEADGPVEAVIRPKAGGAPLKAAAFSGAGELEFLDFGTAAPVPIATAALNALPAWAVVALPDYSPDIGHFVSLWDLGLSNGRDMVGPTLKSDDTHHKMVRAKSHTERYLRMDYRVHIHPQLCSFRDVNWISGATSEDPGHHTTTPSGPAPTGTNEAKIIGQLQRGGIRIDPRAPDEFAKLKDPLQLKDPDAGKPLADWLKIAFLERLRMPGNLYNSKRKFFEGSTQEDRIFPRRLGRRWAYSAALANTAEIDFPDSYDTKLPGTKSGTGGLEDIPGSLKVYHNIVKKPDRMCGGPGGPPRIRDGHSHPSGYDDDKLNHLDDMYWPINAANMPLLRELAYTPIQYDHFKIWKSATPDLREWKIFDDIVSPQMDAAFKTAQDIEAHFALLLDRRPKFVPALIDMASLGSAIGGSFLPGIEVGLEGGRLQNWTLYHGGTDYFPDVRFEKSTSTAANQQHFPGFLTKDLAIPWTRDYRACTEDFWPTARPGWSKTTAAGPPKAWLIPRASGEPRVDYFTNYWQRLGFIRRNAADEFLEI